MENDTATNIRMRDRFRIDLRLQRAEQMTAAVLQKLDRFLDPEDKGHAYHALRELFLESGVEVLTDEDRREAGLPARDDYGWTPQELNALELLRLQTMMKPISMVIPSQPSQERT